MVSSFYTLSPLRCVVPLPWCVVLWTLPLPLHLCVVLVPLNPSISGGETRYSASSLALVSASLTALSTMTSPYSADLRTVRATTVTARHISNTAAQSWAIAANMMLTPVVRGYPMAYPQGDDGLGKWGVCSAFILS